MDGLIEALRQARPRNANEAAVFAMHLRLMERGCAPEGNPVEWNATPDKYKFSYSHSSGPVTLKAAVVAGETMVHVSAGGAVDAMDFEVKQPAAGEDLLNPDGSFMRALPELLDRFDASVRAVQRGGGKSRYASVRRSSVLFPLMSP